MLLVKKIVSLVESRELRDGKQHYIQREVDFIATNEIKKPNPMRNSKPLTLPPHAQPALKYLSKPRS